MTTGRPPWVPTDRERADVNEMAGRGVPEKMIAAIIGVDKLTLRKHCAEDLIEGRARAVKTVLGSLYGAATEGDFHSARLYLANTIGWQLTQKIEHVGRIDTGRLERGRARAAAAASGTVLTGDQADADADGGDDD